MAKLRSTVFLSAAALSLAIAPAQAGGDLIGDLWPTPSAELGTPDFSGFSFGPDASFTGFAVTGTADAGFDDLDGHRVGGYVGYDAQIGNFLIGAYVDGTWGTMSDHGDGALTGFKADLKSFGTVRGRLGYVFDRWMVYGTGGAAFGEMRVSGPTGRQEETLSGWVAGGGIEYMWWKGTSFRFEVTRVELDDERFSNLPDGSDTLGAEGTLFDFGFIRRF